MQQGEQPAVHDASEVSRPAFAGKTGYSQSIQEWRSGGKGVFHCPRAMHRIRLR
jgi:hypothetical protein